MRILIVNPTDIYVEVGRARYTIHNVLLAQNVKSKILVFTKSTDDYIE